MEKLGRLGHGAEALGAELGERGLSGRGIENAFLEQIRIETAEGFPVGVAHCVAHLGPLGALLAKFRHKIGL